MSGETKRCLLASGVCVGFLELGANCITFEDKRQREESSNDCSRALILYSSGALVNKLARTPAIRIRIANTDIRTWG